MHGAGIGKSRAFARNVSGGLLQTSLQIAQIGGVLQQFFGLDHGGHSFLVAVDHPRPRLVQGGTAARQFAGSPFSLR